MARMNEEGMAAVNALTIEEVLRDYKDLGIYYVCADGKAEYIGCEDWDD